MFGVYFYEDLWSKLTPPFAPFSSFPIIIPPYHVKNGKGGTAKKIVRSL